MDTDEGTAGITISVAEMREPPDVPGTRYHVERCAEAVPGTTTTVQPYGDRGVSSTGAHPPFPSRRHATKFL